MKKLRKHMKKLLKNMKSLLDPAKFLKHAGIAAAAGGMVGGLAAIIRSAF